MGKNTTMLETFLNDSDDLEYDIDDMEMDLDEDEIEEYKGKKITKLKPAKRHKKYEELPYSAGVFLYDRKYPGMCAVLHRADTGKYGMFAGKLEKNETLIECAIRECKEESGVELDPMDLGPRYFSISWNPDPDKTDYWVSIWSAEINFDDVTFTDSEEGSVEIVTIQEFLSNSGYADFHSRMLAVFEHEIPVHNRRYTYV